MISLAGFSKASQFADRVAAGDRARDAGEWAAAVAAYSAAIGSNPSALWVKVQIGHCLKEMSDYPAARAAYLAYLERNVADPDIHLQLGHLAMREEAYSDAERCYATAVERAEPDSFIATAAAAGAAAARKGPLLRRRKQALALTDEKRFAEAEPIIRDLVEKEGQEDLVGILGNVSRELGRLADAAKRYEQYRAFAADKSFDLRFDAELQSARLANVTADPALALKHYIRANNLLPDCENPSASPQAIGDEIRRLTRSLCGALAPKR